MEISIESQLLAIFNSFFLGILLGVIYQFFKAFELPLIRNCYGDFDPKNKAKLRKNTINHSKKGENKKILKKSLQVLLDFLYFVAISPIYAIFFYEMSDGVVRWYVFAFSLAGFIVFQKTIGKIIGKAMDFIEFHLENLFAFFFYKFKSVIMRIFKKRAKAKKSKKSKERIILSYGK